MSSGGKWESSFNITGITRLLGIGRVISHTLIPTVCPFLTDLMRGSQFKGFRNAVFKAPVSSGKAGR